MSLFNGLNSLRANESQRKLLCSLKTINSNIFSTHRYPLISKHYFNTKKCSFKTFQIGFGRFYSHRNSLKLGSFLGEYQRFIHSSTRLCKKKEVNLNSESTLDSPETPLKQHNEALFIDEIPSSEQVTKGCHLQRGNGVTGPVIPKYEQSKITGVYDDKEIDKNIKNDQHVIIGERNIGNNEQSYEDYRSSITEIEIGNDGINVEHLVGDNDNNVKKNNDISSSNNNNNITMERVEEQKELISEIHNLRDESLYSRDDDLISSRVNFNSPKENISQGRESIEGESQNFNKSNGKEGIIEINPFFITQSDIEKDSRAKKDLLDERKEVLDKKEHNSKDETLIEVLLINENDQQLTQVEVGTTKRRRKKKELKQETVIDANDQQMIIRQIEQETVIDANDQQLTQVEVETTKRRRKKKESEQETIMDSNDQQIIIQDVQPTKRGRKKKELEQQVMINANDQQIITKDVQPTKRGRKKKELEQQVIIDANDQQMIIQQIEHEKVIDANDQQIITKDVQPTKRGRKKKELKQETVIDANDQQMIIRQIEQETVIDANDQQLTQVEVETTKRRRKKKESEQETIMDSNDQQIIIQDVQPTKRGRKKKELEQETVIDANDQQIITQDVQPAKRSRKKKEREQETIMDSNDQQMITQQIEQETVIDANDQQLTQVEVETTKRRRKKKESEQETIMDSNDQQIIIQDVQPTKRGRKKKELEQQVIINANDQQIITKDVQPTKRGRKKKELEQQVIIDANDQQMIIQQIEHEKVIDANDQQIITKDVQPTKRGRKKKELKQETVIDANDQQMIIRQIEQETVIDANDQQLTQVEVETTKRRRKKKESEQETIVMEQIINKNEHSQKKVQDQQERIVEQKELQEIIGCQDSMIIVQNAQAQISKKLGKVNDKISSEREIEIHPRESISQDEHESQNISKELVPFQIPEQIVDNEKFLIEQMMHKGEISKQITYMRQILEMILQEKSMHKLSEKTSYKDQMEEKEKEQTIHHERFSDQIICPEENSQLKIREISRERLEYTDHNQIPQNLSGKLMDSGQVARKKSGELSQMNMGAKILHEVSGQIEYNQQLLERSSQKIGEQMVRQECGLKELTHQEEIPQIKSQEQLIIQLIDQANTSKLMDREKLSEVVSEKIVGQEQRTNQKVVESIGNSDLLIQQRELECKDAKNIELLSEEKQQKEVKGISKEYENSDNLEKKISEKNENSVDIFEDFNRKKTKYYNEAYCKLLAEKTVLFEEFITCNVENSDLAQLESIQKNLYIAAYLIEWPSIKTIIDLSGSSNEKGGNFSKNKRIKCSKKKTKSSSSKDKDHSNSSHMNSEDSSDTKYDLTGDHNSKGVKILKREAKMLIRYWKNFLDLTALEESIKNYLMKNYPDIKLRYTILYEGFCEFCLKNGTLDILDENNQFSILLKLLGNIPGSEWLWFQLFDINDLRPQSINLALCLDRNLYYLLNVIPSDHVKPLYHKTFYSILYRQMVSIFRNNEISKWNSIVQHFSELIEAVPKLVECYSLAWSKVSLESSMTRHLPINTKITGESELEKRFSIYYLLQNGFIREALQTLMGWLQKSSNIVLSTHPTLRMQELLIALHYTLLYDNIGGPLPIDPRAIIRIFSLSSVDFSMMEPILLNTFELVCFTENHTIAERLAKFCLSEFPDKKIYIAKSMTLMYSLGKNELRFSRWYNYIDKIPFDEENSHIVFDDLMNIPLNSETLISWVMSHYSFPELEKFNLPSNIKRYLDSDKFDLSDYSYEKDYENEIDSKEDSETISNREIFQDVFKSDSSERLDDFKTFGGTRDSNSNFKSCKNSFEYVYDNNWKDKIENDYLHQLSLVYKLIRFARLGNWEEFKKYICINYLDFTKEALDPMNNFICNEFFQPKLSSHFSHIIEQTMKYHPRVYNIYQKQIRALLLSITDPNSETKVELIRFYLVRKQYSEAINATFSPYSTFDRFPERAEFLLRWFIASENYSSALEAAEKFRVLVKYHHNLSRFLYLFRYQEDANNFFELCKMKNSLPILIELWDLLSNSIVSRTHRGIQEYLIKSAIDKNDISFLLLLWKELDTNYILNQVETNTLIVSSRLEVIDLKKKLFAVYSQSEKIIQKRNIKFIDIVNSSYSNLRDYILFNPKASENSSPLDKDLRKSELSASKHSPFSGYHLSLITDYHYDVHNVISDLSDTKNDLYISPSMVSEGDLTRSHKNSTLEDQI